MFIIDYYRLGLPTPPEPSARLSPTMLKHAVLYRLSRVSICRCVQYLGGYSSLKGCITYFFTQKYLKLKANAHKLRSYIAKNT